MSDILNAAAETLREKLGSGELDGSVKFQIEELGAIRLEGAEVSIDDSDADCVIAADQDTFESMVAGDLDPAAAFMSGKLSIDGDMSKAMALAQILG